MSAFNNDGGADAASAESARHALLLATRALGVNAAAVREERKRRCAAERQLNWLLVLFLEEEDGADKLLSHAANDDNDQWLRYALSHGAGVNAAPFFGGGSLLSIKPLRLAAPLASGGCSRRAPT